MVCVSFVSGIFNVLFYNVLRIVMHVWWDYASLSDKNLEEV